MTSLHIRFFPLPSRYLCALLCVLAFSGCASQRAPMAQDPLEGFNRAMFTVNEGLDTVALKPLAQGYEAAVPSLVQKSVGNFFSNFRDLVRSGNAFLQGRGEAGVSNLGRFLVNSSLGVLGFFDMASEIGMEQYDADFGQTLAVWGFPSGPYLFLPIVGPSGARDLVGWGVDQYASPIRAYLREHPAERNTLIGVSAVHSRAALLPVERIVEEAALDKYAYIRSAYLQRRAAMLNGNSSTPPRYDDMDDEDDDSNQISPNLPEIEFSM